MNRFYPIAHIQDTTDQFVSITDYSRAFNCVIHFLDGLFFVCEVRHAPRGKIHIQGCTK